MDIVCLQEIFFSDVQQQIFRALRGTYPFALSGSSLSHEEDPAKSGDYACTMQDLVAYNVCIGQNCLDMTGVALNICFNSRSGI